MTATTISPWLRQARAVRSVLRAEGPAVLATGQLQQPRTASAPARVGAFEHPVADHAAAPPAVVLERQDEAADRPLAALVVAIEQVDREQIAATKAARISSRSEPGSRIAPCQKPVSPAGT